MKNVYTLLQRHHAFSNDTFHFSTLTQKDKKIYLFIPHTEAELNSYMQSLFNVTPNNTTVLQNLQTLVTKNSTDVGQVWIKVVSFGILFNS
jgi:hypothetical protein